MPMIPGDNPMQAALRYAQQGGQPQPTEGGADWLVNAINEVHKGMVEEGDPKQISLLGAILNQLTTFQANRANTGATAQAAQGAGG
jgi:hypothetical protein